MYPRHARRGLRLRLLEAEGGEHEHEQRPDRTTCRDGNTEDTSVLTRQHLLAADRLVDLAHAHVGRIRLQPVVDVQRPRRGDRAQGLSMRAEPCERDWSLAYLCRSAGVPALSGVEGPAPELLHYRRPYKEKAGCPCSRPFPGDRDALLDDLDRGTDRERLRRRHVRRALPNRPSRARRERPSARRRPARRKRRRVVGHVGHRAEAVIRPCRAAGTRAQSCSRNRSSVARHRLVRCPPR